MRRSSVAELMPKSTVTSAARSRMLSGSASRAAARGETVKRLGGRVLAGSVREGGIVRSCAVLSTSAASRTRRLQKRP
jgi:hypothetical protein